MRNRRGFLIDVAKGVAAVGAGTLAPRLARAAERVTVAIPGLPSGAAESAVLEALAGKRPLIKRTSRPRPSRTKGRVQLKDGPGKDVVLAQCSVCHSVDYIPLNSPFLDGKGWEAEVNKMVKVMGRPSRPRTRNGSSITS